MVSTVVIISIFRKHEKLVFEKIIGILIHTKISGGEKFHYDLLAE
jgi:hypothetical protein